MKILLFLLLLCPLFGQSQIFVDLGAGVESTNNYPVAKISAGYERNNVVLEAVEQITATRASNSANYFGMKAGYHFNNFVPAVGYLYNYRSADDKNQNHMSVVYCLKYILPIGDNGGLYAEGLYAEKALWLTAGFHIVF